ncbi:hypothetical protein GCM10023339_20370 [Alloalcanivorax gelatiniphagus]
MGLKDKGLHYTEDGVAVIQSILNRPYEVWLNNFRLSTSLKSPTIDRNELDRLIGKLLNGPSNYENIDGNTFIISLNRFKFLGGKKGVEIVDEKGSVLFRFDTITDCAKYLGIPYSALRVKLKNGKSIAHEGKLVYVKKKNELTNYLIRNLVLSLASNIVPVTLLSS